MAERWSSTVKQHVNGVVFLATVQGVVGFLLQYWGAIVSAFDFTWARQAGAFVEWCLYVEGGLWVIAAVVYACLPHTTPVARWLLAHGTTSLL